MPEFEVGDRVIRVKHPGNKTPEAHWPVIGRTYTVSGLSAFRDEPTVMLLESPSGSWSADCFELAVEYSAADEENAIAELSQWLHPGIPHNGHSCAANDVRLRQYRIRAIKAEWQLRRLRRLLKEK